MELNWDKDFYDMLDLTQRPAPVENQDNDSQNQYRLQRNRESAKASRERKKIYIQHLEEKVQRLSEEVASLKHAQSIPQDTPSTEQFLMKTFSKGEKQLFENLQSTLAQPTDTADEECDVIINEIRNRIGSVGIE